MTQDLSNIEKMLNICANLDEILGIRYALLLVLGALFLLKLKMWKTAGIYSGGAIACLLFGLATPGVINWLVASAADANVLPTASIIIAVVMGTLSLFMLLFGFYLLYLPVKIAKQNGKENLGNIIGFSAFSIIIPFLWPFAIYFAYKPHKPVVELQGPQNL